MVRKIAIIDESNPDFSADRSRSLLKRLSRVEECPLEDPDLPDISWHAEICAAKNLKARIGEFWLAWVHDGTSGLELKSVTDAAVAQERKMPGVLPTVIVCYGGGVASTYPPRGVRVTKQIEVVASRILWTRECDAVENFANGPAAGWNLGGFLRSVAESFPSVDRSQLMLLCGKTKTDRLSLTSVAHSTEQLVRLLEGEMLEAIRGCLPAAERFTKKASTVVRAIEDLQEGLNGILKDESSTSSGSNIMRNLTVLKQLVEKLQNSGVALKVTYQDGHALLQSLNANCAELRAIDSRGNRE
jgi:hypothetical protein